MTVRQLKTSCFELDPNPWGDDSANPHYATFDEAHQALTTLRREREEEPGRTWVKSLARPCWVAECDSDGCDESYEDEEGGGHFADPGVVLECMAADGWGWKAPDLAFCWNDSDEGQPVPSSPAELEAAGQMRLPGVA